MTSFSLSVIIPAHNASRTLKRAVDSVLTQSGATEIVIIDDASTDDTAELARSFGDDRVRLIRNERSAGAAGARNIGIEASRGELIAFQDADDEWLPGKLSAQLAVLAADPAVTFVSCDSNIIAPDGTDSGPLYPGRPAVSGDQAWRVLLKYNFIATPSVVVRRSAIEAVGLFDKTLKVGEDQDMWIRLAMAGPIGYVGRKLLLVHDTPNSLSNRNFRDQLDYTLPMIRRHIERKRAELSGAEIRGITGMRIGRVGRSAVGQGLLSEGIPMVVRALVMGNSPRENLRCLASALLPVRTMRSIAAGLGLRRKRRSG